VVFELCIVSLANAELFYKNWMFWVYFFVVIVTTCKILLLLHFKNAFVIRNTWF
jgi:hypothetical protein